MLLRTMPVTATFGRKIVNASSLPEAYDDSTGRGFRDRRL